MTDETDNIIGVLAIARDITDKKLADEELWKNHSLYSQTEQMGKLGYWGYDEINDRLIIYSDQYANIFEITKEQLLETITSYEKELEFIHEDDVEQYK